MTEKSAEAKKVLIFHVGQGHGPMSTGAGSLLPGQSLEVPEDLAVKLCRAYKHVKLAKDVIPGGGADPRLAKENAMLQAEVDRLNKLLAAAPPADAAALQQQVGDLQAVVQEFLGADSKKALEALQEKHADVVPAPEATKEPGA